MNELIADFQHLPLAKELATALGIQGEPTLIEAVVMSLFIQAIKGDTNATKLIQAVTEPQHKGQFPPGPPPSLSIVWVKPDGTRVRAQEERPKELPAPDTEIEFDFTGDGGEIEALPPFAQENKQ